MKAYEPEVIDLIAESLDEQELDEMYATEYPSAEESVVILAGRATATIGGERKALEGPALVVMPEGVTHDLTNEGDDTLRAVGYFPRNSVTTTFEQEMQPNGSHTAGTPDRAS